VDEAQLSEVPNAAFEQQRHFAAVELQESTSMTSNLALGLRNLDGFDSFLSQQKGSVVGNLHLVICRIFSSKMRPRRQNL
jgi:hypothetical protein